MAKRPIVRQLEFHNHLKDGVLIARLSFRRAPKIYPRLLASGVRGPGLAEQRDGRQRASAVRDR